MIERVAGKIKAAPRPWIARKAISVSAFGAREAAPAAPPKMTTPMLNQRRRPKRSPTVPPTSKSPANIRIYAFTTHWRVEVEAPRSREMAGRAVLTTAESRNTIKAPRHITASTHPRLEFGLALSTVPASTIGGPSAGRTCCPVLIVKPPGRSSVGSRQRRVVEPARYVGCISRSCWPLTATKVSHHLSLVRAAIPCADQPDTHMDIGDSLELKIRALAVHRSQTSGRTESEVAEFVKERAAGDGAVQDYDYAEAFRNLTFRT